MTSESILYNLALYISVMKLLMVESRSCTHNIHLLQRPAPSQLGSLVYAPYIALITSSGHYQLKISHILTNHDLNANGFFIIF